MIPTPSTLSETSDAGTAEVDAMALLVADHDEVNELFIEYHDLVRGHAMDAERRDLVEQLCQALSVHATVEEEVFYPAARDALGDPGLIERAEQEHAAAKALIEQLQAMDASEEHYDSTVRQLQAAVEQHVQQEEAELFPQVRDSSLDIFAVGIRMAERRDELFAQIEEEGTGR